MEQDPNTEVLKVSSALNHQQNILAVLWKSFPNQKVHQVAFRNNFRICCGALE